MELFWITLIATFIATVVAIPVGLLITGPGRRKRDSLARQQAAFALSSTVKGGFLYESRDWAEAIDRAASQGAIIPGDRGNPHTNSWALLQTMNLIPSGFEVRVIQLASEIRELDRLTSPHIGLPLPSHLKTPVLWWTQHVISQASEILQELQSGK